MSRLHVSLLIVILFSLSLPACAGSNSDLEVGAEDVQQAEATRAAAQQRLDEAAVASDEAIQAARVELEGLENQMHQEQKQFGVGILLLTCATSGAALVILAILVAVYIATRTGLQRELEHVALEIEEQRSKYEYEQERQNYYRSRQGRGARHDDNYR